MRSLSAATTPTIPAALAGLLELALDLRWTWSHSADVLWDRLDHELWTATRSPWLLLQLVHRARLEELAHDHDFVALVHHHLEERERLLETPGWFRERHHNFNLSVAYFSLEFGLSEGLPIYAGGLGILAGDLLKTASDLAVPLVGVGLLYQRGYFRQDIDARGEQRESFPQNDPSQLPIIPLRSREGDWLVVSVDLPGRKLRLRAWEAIVGRTRLYLLDSNDPLNEAADRGITAELYGGSPEQRLQQELALGIGGWRLLRLLGEEPAVCHLNEGHSAFAVLARAHGFMQDHGVDFDVALAATRAGNVFTTHTPLAYGFDRFPPWMAAHYLSPMAALLGLELESLLALGRETPEPSEAFNMAFLAARGSIAINAVSEAHLETSRTIFGPLFPRWPRAEMPMISITNGIHPPSWDSAEIDEIWTSHCGKERWRDYDPALGESVRQVPDDLLWNAQNAGRRRLVEYARTRLKRQLRGAGGHTEFEHVLDPDVLTLGFARRFTDYKRPDLLLRDTERLMRLLENPRMPVQLVISGKAHPSDPNGKALVAAWVKFTRRARVAGRVVFLADYDMDMAEHLVQGVDIWINTPRRGMEACGTSGMKILINGGLNLSSAEGWWAEAYGPGRGWNLPDADATDDEAAVLLYTTLERDVVPCFYDRDDHELPVRWLHRVRASMCELTQPFSTNRTLDEYITRMYLPAHERLAARTAEGGQLARTLVDHTRQLREEWAHVRFGDLNVTRKENALTFRVAVYLGSVDKSLVAAELYADGKAGPPEVHVLTELEPLPCGGLGFIASCTISTERPAADYTPRLVPRVPGLCVPLECPQITWYA